MSNSTFDPYPAPADLSDASVDENVKTDEVDEADETDEATSEGPARPTRRAPSRAAIRRIANKAQEISETDTRVVSLAATILGTGTGISDLTLAIMAAPRGATGALADLNMVAESDPLEAGIHAAALGRDRLRAVWNLLNALTGSTSALPAATTRAAVSVVKTTFGLDEVAKAEIEAVAALLKKN